MSVRVRTDCAIQQEELLRTSQKTVSACLTEDEEEELAMNLAGMAGTFITAMIVQVVALLLGGLEYFTGRTIQDWLVMIPTLSARVHMCFF